MSGGYNGDEFRMEVPDAETHRLRTSMKSLEGTSTPELQSTWRKKSVRSRPARKYRS